MSSIGNPWPAACSPSGQASKDLPKPALASRAFELATESQLREGRGRGSRRATAQVLDEARDAAQDFAYEAAERAIGAADVDGRARFERARGARQAFAVPARHLTALLQGNGPHSAPPKVDRGMQPDPREPVVPAQT